MNPGPTRRCRPRLSNPLGASVLRTSLCASLLLTCLVFAGLLTSCRQRWPDVTVTVVNQSGSTLESLMSKVPGDTDWGGEILSASVEHAGSVSFVALKGIYDFRALLSDSSAAYMNDVDLTALELFTITLTGEETQ